VYNIIWKLKSNKSGGTNEMSVVTITKENFKQEVMMSDKLVLIDFWAQWCAPCRALSPVVEEIAGELLDIKVGKINVDDCPELASQFGVTGIPALFLIKNGKAVDKSVGVKPKKAIVNMIEAHL
jgi:thioredoxin 1